MNRGLSNPPQFPPPHMFSINILCVDRHVMRQRLAFHFGIAFSDLVMQSTIPFVYPIVTYGPTWDCTIFILY